MRKCFSLFLIGCLILLSLGTTYVDKNMTPIKTLPSIKGIKLYVDLENDNSNSYSNFHNYRLIVNKREKSFNWESMSDIMWPPYIELLDLNNDKNKELIVFMTLGQGTGVYLNKAHIINLMNFKEYPIEDALKIVKEHVKTSVTNNTFYINIDSEGQEFNYRKYNGEKIYNKVYFGSRLEYNIQNNLLIADVGANISINQYIGHLHIEYKYLHGIYILKKIYFINEKP